MSTPSPNRAQATVQETPTIADGLGWFAYPPFLPLDVLTPPRQAALRQMTGAAFRDATVRLNTALARRFGAPLPKEEGDLRWLGAITYLIDEVLKPLLSDVWAAVEKCLRVDGARIDENSESVLYRYGDSWAKSCGFWIADRLLGQLRHFTTDEEFKAAKRIIREFGPSLANTAFGERFWEQCEIAMALQAGASAENVEKWYSAKYYAEFDISADTLRQAAHDGRIQKRKGNGNRNEYRDADVRRRWPHLFPS